MGEACSSHGRDEKCNTILWSGGLKVRDHLEDWHGWEDNTRMDLREMG